MLRKHHELRATKSQRSIDAESFLRAALDILENEYGCAVDLIGDPLSIESTSFSPEYMAQVMSILATVARGGREAKVIIEVEADQLTASATAPRSVYTGNLASSYLTESSADLGDFSYVIANKDDKVTARITIKLKKCAAIALYAISKNELLTLFRELIKR